MTMLSSSAALAQECANDDDCDDGYSCQVAGTSAGCAAPTCAPGDEECAKTPPDCPEPEEFKLCMPAPCETDDDCGDAMVCYAYATGSCSGSAGRPAATPCAEGQDCAGAEEKRAPEPPEEQCTTETVSVCTPRYQLPCEHDDDCGEGFTCKETISVTCSGSGAAGGSAGGNGGAGGGQDAKPAPDPEPAETPEQSCDEQPTGEFRCELQELPCDANADCPADFECSSNPNRAVCTSAGGATPSDPGAGGRSGGGSAGASGGADDGDAADPAGDRAAPADDACGGANDGLPEKVCLPKHYYESGGVSRGEDSSSNGMAGGAQGIPATDPTSKGGVDEDNVSHDGDDGAAGAGATNTGSHTDGDADAESGDDGCSVAAHGAHGTHGAWGSLGLIGLSVLALRRRARKAA
jgi:hypothetical protein